MRGIEANAIESWQYRLIRPIVPITTCANRSYQETSMNSAATAKSIFWAAIEAGSLTVLSLLTIIVLARLLGPAEFGLAHSPSRLSRF